MKMLYVIFIAIVMFCLIRMCGEAANLGQSLNNHYQHIEVEMIK